ncbi:MAG: B12-binding domain-containing radical SAM protein [Candidatus Hydrogenedentes bacterium]|nr:B12-binding domain-containing radical SAM protein [Candidatus Hydrogenedentota bacterium]
MKITLISPKMSLRPMDSEYKRRLSPSLSLLTLAALTPAEHQITIQDENVGPIRFDQPADLVGVNVNVDTSVRAYAIARRFRERGVPVILGGIHASASPDEALDSADAVCIGGAEGVWEQVLADAQNGGLKPRYQKTGPIDAAMIPGPRWELLDASRYLYTNIVCASRGCCFRCEFCYNSADYVHPGCRPRPIERVLADIRRLNTKQVMFIDDNLIGNVAWARELVHAIAPLGLTWHAAVSTNIGRHLDLLDAMRSAGCRSLFIGFESINGDSVRNANKRQNNIADYAQIIRAIHERGMMVNASLVLGFDEDGPGVFDKTLAWLIQNKVETMTAHILTPYPGTKLYARLEREGRIEDRDPSHYNTANVVFTPKRMTKSELYEGYLRMYREFYSFRGIYRRIPNERQNLIPYLLFNLCYRKFGKLTSACARWGLMRAAGQLARRLSYGIG